ncbi:hypothetical protein EFW58_01579 [Bacillus velezensis]|nr:hypothetical protein EFW58_01579 [Bacillus velezensis]
MPKLSFKEKSKDNQVAFFCSPLLLEVKCHELLKDTEENGILKFWIKKG